VKLANSSTNNFQRSDREQGDASHIAQRLDALVDLRCAFRSRLELVQISARAFLAQGRSSRNGAAAVRS
jgi:hypothetical protein